MRWGTILIPTLREIPKEAEAKSHQLLLKAGYIRKLSSGVYSYLPLGFRVLQNICRIIREEMNSAGAVELLLPALQPAEIWKQTGRYDALGEDKISFKNRTGTEYVLGPTHEEVITELAGAYLQTQHALPKTLYQIQTKFRDELRPRFGIIRTKEFIMKDAYSFDADEEGLKKSYQNMYHAYQKILTRLGLSFDIVTADPGIMGGKVSHEFMVRSEYGEDHLAVCETCKMVTSRDIAARKLSKQTTPPTSSKIEIFDTPNLKTIHDISTHFHIAPRKLMKTIIYMMNDRDPVAACVRGDHEVHEGKLRNLLGAKQLCLANAKEIEKVTGAPLGFASPVGLRDVKIIIDADLLLDQDFVTGANQKDKHMKHVNVGRDFNYSQSGDIRFVQEGDLCAQCGNKLLLITAMEVGHVFQLGTRYTECLNVKYKDSSGAEKLVIMGCYGLGVNRIMAAIVEQHNDSKGMKWPVAVAPFQVELLTVNHSHDGTREAADQLYSKLIEAGIDCLYDDREERAGVKFNDADLVGAPFHVVVGERNLVKGVIEIKKRASQESLVVPISEVLGKVQELLRD
ncbi:MAG: proline--tRNA ligase [Omnitrophica bacterium RIFCSPLOWO2_12_FULL_44_17]|uniref:Proline--tRNA ligase n=1 Tax=Candidatus Danuiimicrobium aquiferis TaxID=1801832 RepID=A0A1G1KYP8_9BACT|nr:MAG: proline--tRNA ligase [Omnitrophica bacterium RIFCSPHIGHO2_02_FULL_45_28]OGW88850.1 MAG: proline--tRNA ligase [Omnitrophica bacterium RIFCSPHIGHO2_12_FULL_44_12]OGW98055.1 MAG: proline--tRNA ligase [Omnitrophica bacterium RIFCSPLOWO2_12_FULL_44_17]OGX03503.1 MAG: proline--tRNA ligase [Omnitrophica bacterium RIFCSPLOWO2_02_FULL_44_11]